ncbi:MAG: SAM-dependent methyltransferase [bacterium]
MLARLRAEFETVKYVKPESSRKDSAEVFLVAMNRR